jgi:PII-like signaling protein
MPVRDLHGNVKQLSAYVGERAEYDGKPLYLALIEQARAQGCAGATALRGLSGFGATSRDVEKHGLRMSTDCPVVVIAIDELTRITALAEVWQAMMPSGMITIDDVRVVAYSGEDGED